MRLPPALHTAAGSPDPRRETHSACGRCYWCAAPIEGRACRVDDVITDSFTDQDQALIRSSPWLCVGCSWAMTGRPPDTLRMWSIAYREDGLPWPASHASAPDLGPRIHMHAAVASPAFRALLRDPPRGRWACAIATSGQIHTTPFATVNDGTGAYAVRFERLTVAATAAQYCELDDIACELIGAGFWRRDIIDGPSPSRRVTGGLLAYRGHFERLAPWRGSALLELVVHLLPKEKHATSTDRGAASEKRSTARARDDEQREQREDPANRVVGACEERDRDRGDVVGQLSLAGLDDGAQTPDRLHDDRDGERHRSARRGRRA